MYAGCGEYGSEAVTVGIIMSGPVFLFQDGARKLVPEDGSQVILVYRFDDRPAVTLKGSWWAVEESAVVYGVGLDDAERFLGFLMSADLLIYRIGEKTSAIRRIELSRDRSLLMNEQVAAYVSEMIASGGLADEG